MSDVDVNIDEAIASVSAVVDAATALVRVWEGVTEGQLNADTLTCSETDTLAELFRTFGKYSAADRLEENHAVGDQPGDSHYREA